MAIAATPWRRRFGSIDFPVRINAMSVIVEPTNQTEIFARSLHQHEPIPIDVARFFLGLELTAADRVRLEQLAEKARLGTLTTLELQDLDEYRRLGRLVELMKLKAQVALRSA
jgi:hypothetical protein